MKITATRLFSGLIVALAATMGCSDSQPTNTTLSADGTQISFDVDGVGEPALVFVHGWSGDRSGWRYQTDVFARDHMVVTLDLAGFGASGNGRDSWTVRRFAEDVVAVVESLGIRKAVLVGHSMGSGVVLEASLLMPDRVVGIVPVDVFQNVEERLTDEEIAQRAARLMNNVKIPIATPWLRRSITGSNLRCSMSSSSPTGPRRRSGGESRSTNTCGGEPTS